MLGHFNQYTLYSKKRTYNVYIFFGIVYIYSRTCILPVITKSKGGDRNASIKHYMGH